MGKPNFVPLRAAVDDDRVCNLVRVLRIADFTTSTESHICVAAGYTKYFLYVT